MINEHIISEMTDSALVEMIGALRSELSRRKKPAPVRIKLTQDELLRAKRFKAKQVNNTSGSKGVTFNSNAGKWQAKIGCDKKIKHLGYFATMDEAISARKIAELEMWGE
jgi:hypothetical protein